VSGGAPSDGPQELPATAVVLTQVVVPEALAAACALQKVAVDVVPTSIGCVAVCRSVEPGDPETAAQVISSGLANTDTPVVLIVHRSGQMSASLWHAGSQTKELSPALALDGLPAVVEALLLGGQSAADVDGVVTSAGVGRLGAMRMLAGVAKTNRRAAKARAARAAQQAGETGSTGETE
jgi:hypothetical protein